LKTLRTTIAALATTAALGAAPALAEGTNPNTRAQGAPGQVCKPFKSLSQQAFKLCVRMTAQDRGSLDGDPRTRASGAPGQVCKRFKTVSQEAFRLCVRMAAQDRGNSRP
jgi:hypothetical protein